MQDLTQTLSKSATNHPPDVATNNDLDLSEEKRRHDAIRLLWLELDRCLVCSGLVTSALNLLRSHKETKCIDHIFRYLPCDANVTMAAARGLVQVGFDDAVRDDLEALALRIKAGRASIERCRVFDGYSDVGDWRELDEVVLAWRKVCALGVAALCGLERSCNALWSPERLRALDRLIEFLGNARDGESPYLGSNGYPVIPCWAEHRRDRRQLVNLWATVRWDGEEHNAIVTDISTHGIGLDRIFGLRRGQRVSIELEDGRLVEGTAAWAAGGRSGIEEICSQDVMAN